MIVGDLMTRGVISVTRDTPVLEAMKIMREHDFRRLPVVDEDGRPVGVVSQRSIESLKPQSGLPLIWQIGPWASHHVVGDVMRKKIVSVKPTDTVEYATNKAQTSKVGTLLVIEDGKMVGVVTTNDIFYNVVNPTLGIGVPGTRIIVKGGGSGDNAEKIISVINKLGVAIKVIWSILSPNNINHNLVLHLDTDDARQIISDLAGLGFDAKTVNR
jgi:acetoin utilization protein AcuB